MCIVDLIKVLTYEFHCDYIKSKYCKNRRLLFTETASLMLEIKTKDVYEDFSKDKEMFDFSNYSTKSRYYEDSNKLVIGMFQKKIFRKFYFMEQKTSLPKWILKF